MLNPFQIPTPARARIDNDDDEGPATNVLIESTTPARSVLRNIITFSNLINLKTPVIAKTTAKPADSPPGTPPLPADHLYSSGRFSSGGGEDGPASTSTPSGPRVRFDVMPSDSVASGMSCGPESRQTRTTFDVPIDRAGIENPDIASLIAKCSAYESEVNQLREQVVSLSSSLNDALAAVGRIDGETDGDAGSGSTAAEPTGWDARCDMLRHRIDTLETQLDQSGRAADDLEQAHQDEMELLRGECNELLDEKDEQIAALQEQVSASLDSRDSADPVDPTDKSAVRIHQLEAEVDKKDKMFTALASKLDELLEEDSRRVEQFNQTTSQLESEIAQLQADHDDEIAQLQADHEAAISDLHARALAAPTGVAAPDTDLHQVLVEKDGEIQQMQMAEITQAGLLADARRDIARLTSVRDHETGQFRDQIAALERNLADVRSAEAASQARISGLELELGQADRGRKSAAEQLEARTQEVADLQTCAVAAATADPDADTANNDREHHQISQLTDLIESRNREISSLQKQLEVALSRADELDQGVARRDQLLAAANQDHGTLVTELNGLKEEIVLLEGALDDMEAENDRLEERLADGAGDRDDRDVDDRMLREDVENIISERNMLRAEVAALEARLEDAIGSDTVGSPVDRTDGSEDDDNGTIEREQVTTSTPDSRLVRQSHRSITSSDGKSTTIAQLTHQLNLARAEISIRDTRIANLEHEIALEPIDHPSPSPTSPTHPTRSTTHSHDHTQMVMDALEHRHTLEMRGIAKHVHILRALVGRHERFRAGLVFHITYLRLQISRFEESQARTLRDLRDIEAVVLDHPPDRHRDEDDEKKLDRQDGDESGETVLPRRSLRAVVWTVIALRRLSEMSTAWARVKRSQDSLARKAAERKRRKAAAAYPV